MDIVTFVCFVIAAIVFGIVWSNENPKTISTPLGLLIMCLGFMAWIWWISDHLHHAIF